MPFEKILDEIQKQKGIEAVVVLDADGETIWSCGSHEPDVLKLTAAHQSVLMSAIRRLGMGGDPTLFASYDGRRILTHHLKDGYLITVIFSAELNFAEVHFSLRKFYDQLEAAL